MMGGLQRTGRGALSQSNSRIYARKPGPEGDHSGERILGQRAGGRGKGKNGSRNPGRGGPKRRTQPDVRLGPRRSDSLESPERQIEGETGLERLDEESLLSLFQEFGKESLSETTLDSTVRVYCTHVQPSCTAPWQRLPQIGSTSSGFIIEGRRIITNAHSVEYASIIQVRKRGCDVKWVAELLHYGMECDLAVLTVRDEKFWEDLHPIEFGPLPQLMDEVSVVGYPIGGESLSVTAGVVSRIELQEYAQGGETLLAIQIDAAINSGNSGGPVINEKDQLVGVAFQTLASHDAENIGYVIPVDILQHFLDDVERHGSYTGFCSLGVKFQPMESPVLRRYKQVPQGESGVLITRIDPLAPSHEVLQRGDVLLGVDGVLLANDGSIPFRKGERVELHYYFSQMFKGDSVNLRILRDGQVMEVRSQLYLHKPAVRSHLKNQLPKYLMVGGLVFTVLSHPFLAAALGESYGPETLADVRLLYLAQSNLKDPSHELVVLCELLENEINLGYELFGRQHLIAFNGVPVENLAHLAQMVDATTEGQMIFELDRDGLIVLDAERAHQATREISVMHGIPVDRSVDLVEGQEGVDAKSSHFQQQHLEQMSADWVADVYQIAVPPLTSPAQRRCVKLCEGVLAFRRVALMRAAHTALASRGGQPDHSIGQMPYDLLEYMSAPPSVMHTSDQTLLAFDSIAATFGFRHHVGTDPSLEIKVIKHILRREMLVARIKAMVNKLRSASDQRHRSDHRSGLLDCLTLLRDSSADTVESVVLWREGLPTYPPPAFIWEGRNYLLKMNRDLDFLAEVDAVADMLGIPRDKLKSNPLVLFDTSMPLEPGMDVSSLLEGADAEKARMLTLAQVLHLEHKFEGERRQHKAETSECADGAGFLGDTRTPERDTDDTNLWRKKINVFNWFDEAQHQLENLKKSMEVGQKLLKAMESTQPMEDFGRLSQDRLQPLAASVPNPMAMPGVLLSPNIATLLDGAHVDRLRHPLETDDLGATFPVPFSHQLGNMLISQVNIKRKKPPPRPCQPKYLENIPSRYLEAPKRPVTTDELDDAHQRPVAKIEARGRRPTITQPRGPVFGKPKSSRGKGRRTKSADAAIPQHQHHHKEQQQQQQQGDTEEEYCVTSMHDPMGREVEEPPKTAIAARRQQKRTRRRAERLRAVARRRKGSEGRYTPQDIVAALTEDDLLQLGLLREPSKALAAAGAAALILLAPGDEIPTNVTWPIFQARISSRNQFLSELANFDCDTVPKFKIRALKNFITSGSDILPTTLLDGCSAGAKISAWMFQVLLLQSDFTADSGPLAAIADAIDQVMRPYEKAEADMSSCTSVGISSVSKADQLSVVTTATKRASILYQHEHIIHEQAVFVTIIGRSDGAGTQVKVYDPITSHEACVEISHDEPFPTPPLQAWVERHLPGLLVLGEDEKLHTAPR